MLQWRDRGYVADSDSDVEIDLEDDEVQNNQDVQESEPGSGREVEEDGEIEAIADNTRGDVAVALEDNAHPNVSSGSRIRKEEGYGGADDVSRHQESAWQELPQDQGTKFKRNSIQSSSQAHSRQESLESEEDQLQLPEPITTTPSRNNANAREHWISHIKPSMDIFDVPSSPLSDAPSDLSMLDPVTSATSRQYPTSRTTRPASLDNTASELSRPLDQTVATEPYVSVAGRIFRQRNPIQLHPYLLEQEQYKQSLKARGVKPVAIASSQSQHNQDNEESQGQDDSQFLDVQGEDESQSPPIPGLSPGSDAGEYVATSPPQAQPPLEYDSDELPDLSNILNGLTTLTERRGSKRRKVLKTYSRSSKPTTYPQPPIAVGKRSHDVDLEPIVLDDVYDVPLSPPLMPAQDSGPSTKIRRKRFKVPRGLPAEQLPTPPETSSQTPRAVRNDIPLFPELSDSESDQTPHLPQLSTRRPSSSIVQDERLLTQPMSISSESSASETEVLKKVSNRLRGVLPASWLRLDQHVQQPRSRRDQMSESPVRTQSHRGIAQRLNRSRPSTPRTTPALSTVFEISDDSDPAPPKSTTSTQPRLRNAFDVLNRTSSRVNTGTRDIEEEDFVDPMLPAATRNRPKGTGRKRQSRLTDTIAGASRSTTSRNGKASSTTSRQRTGQPRTNRRQPPRLSLLDSSYLPQRSQQPDFLKVASRQARSLPNKARHSPINKIIQMQDKRNDAEVKKTLDDWRRGRVRPVDTATLSEKRRSERASSAQHDPYRQQRLPAPVSEGTLMLKGLLGKPQRPRPKSASSRLRQSRLDVDSVSRPWGSLNNKAEVTKRTINQASGGQHRHRKSGRAVAGQLEEVRLERMPHLHRSGLDHELRTMRLLAQAERPHERNTSNLVLERFLEDTTIPLAPALDDEAGRKTRREVIPSKRRQRKSTPHRLHFDEADIDIASNASVVSTPAPSTSARPLPTRTMEGLGPFGTYYTTDFDIKPLPVGTCFASSTFVGSGELGQALHVNSRDMDVPTPSRTLMNIGDRVLHLGPWTEETSTQISDALTYCVEQDRAEHTSASKVMYSRTVDCLRKLVQYVSTTLYFLDSIDRAIFLTSMLGKIKHVLQEFEAVAAASEILAAAESSVNVLTMTVVLVGQCISLSNSDMVGARIKEDFRQLLQQLVNISARVLFRNGLVQLWALHRRASTSVIVEAGLGLEEHEAEFVVVHHHLLTRLDIPGLSFTDFVNIGLAQRSLTTCYKISVLDRSWHDLIAIMPLLSLDETGILVRSSRAASDLGSLDAVKDTLKTVFELYRTHLCDLSRPINPYVRATLSRCFVLIRTWGWCRCEAALGTIFDFFARDGFALLKNEEATDSPHFLKELESGNMPTLETGDRSFDIFLKTLFVGFHNLRAVLPDKKIRNIAWRFIPNHGRQYDKDSTLRPVDLQALRNTHDLLSVLYAASPAGFRPNLDLFRNLVNFSSSHSEACKLNIRSWSNLARFQLSEGGDSDALEPFVAWYNDMISKLVQQHRQARIEAQAQSERSNTTGAALSKALVESTIAANQRQIGGVLVMALVALKDIIQHNIEDGPAIALFERIALNEVLGLFGSEDTRLNNVLIPALQTYQAVYRRMRHPKMDQARAPSPRQSEDSQDFGDFPDMEDIEDIIILGDSPHQPVSQTLTNPIQQLLSNCFGTESCVDDVLLRTVVEVWVEACDLTVSKQQKSWTYYLDPRSSGSWTQLRDTDLKRKYYAYYMAAIMDIASSVIDSCNDVVIAAWLVSLVERESTLKYQHRLTSALLNACPGHPLLANLPFSRDSSSHRYEISLADLSQRRLAVLSTVFSEMRRSLESSFINGTNSMQQLRHQYQDTLRQLMSAMKTNYQEIQQGSNTRGSYIDFVQKVVEALQEYTSDIVPIDRFFMDSASFPLPASDPTYVVGRLKSYGLKADELGEQKKLVMFFQAVCERAAVDNQQVYLSEQLTKSVKDCREGGGKRSTLRALLFSGILPAYLETAFSTECGWILVIPILDSLTHMLKDLIVCFNLFDDAAREVVTTMATDMGIALCAAFRSSAEQHFHQSWFWVTLGVTYSIIEALASVIDYVHRHASSATIAIQSVAFLQHFGRHIVAGLGKGSHELYLTSDITTLLEQSSIVYSSKFDNARAFCRQELSKSIKNNWTKQGDEYFVYRGNTRRQVNVAVGDLTEEKEGALTSVKRCLNFMESLPSFGRPRLWKDMEVRCKDPGLMV